MYTGGTGGVNGSTRRGRGRLPRKRPCGSIERMHERALLGSAIFLLAACGGGGGGGAMNTVVIRETPEPNTRATLAGPLCKADACTCRDPSAPADGGAGVAAEGRKRFEVRVGPIEQPAWVTIDRNVLYKSAARAEDCFYVDLAPGEHPVEIRASHAGGLSVAVRLSEYAPGTESWYDTYDFSCGVPGVCAHSELDAYKRSLARFERGIHDPCGSVKIKGLSWDSGVAADQVHPQDLAVALTLLIYDFAPKHPTGSPDCRRRFE